MTPPSYHARHRGLLELATDADAMAALMERVSDQLPSLRRNRATAPWHRTWGRLGDPARGRIDLLLQSGDEPSTICAVTLGADGPGRGSVIDPVFGPVRFRAFPDDQRLPTLAPFVARHPDIEVVRYRPGKRCTFHRRDATGGRYIKLFRDDRGRHLAADGARLWRAARAGALGFAVAEPVGYDPTFGTYIQRRVPGRPVMDTLFGGDGCGLAHQLGAAAATLVTADLRLTAIHDADAELRRTRRRAAEIAAYTPALAEPLDDMVAALTDMTARLRHRVLRPIHGSPHPNQWLVDTGGLGLGLVDFDRLCLGDPELDVATFAAEVDFEPVDDPAAISESFAAGYRERHPDLDPDRLVLYRAHKRLAKVHRTVRAVRPDGDRRAADHLRTTVAGLNRAERVGP